MTSRLSEDQSRVADLVAAVAADQRDLSVGNLPLRAVNALQLPRALDDLQHALDVGLRKLAAGRVGGAPALEPQRSRPRERSPLAFLAEPVVLELREHHVGKTVIDLRGIDVARPEPGHMERARATLDRTGRNHVVFLDPAL